MVIINEDDYLQHYGILRRSGRYPWGSGKDDETHNSALLNHVAELKKQGLTEKQIAKGLGLSVGQLRAEHTIALAQTRQAKIAMAERLKAKGMSGTAIAERMGLSGESAVRALLAPGAADRSKVLFSTADMLKAQVDEKKFLDVGKGTEHFTEAGVSRERMNAALEILKTQGYEVHNIKHPQATTGKDTEMRVLVPPGTTWGDVQRNRASIRQIQEFSEDGGRTFTKVQDPLSIDPKRVDVVYKEQGGDKADGMIYVRPGVEDTSLGGTPYGQVRIKVGNDHFIKGMAMYKDGLPPGVDLQFHTSKSSTGNHLDAMKKLKDDPELPFGSVVRQIVKDPGTSKERVSSVMNLVGNKEGAGEEGGWESWSRSLSSQFLSKQEPSLAKQQLAMTYQRRKTEYDAIMALTNPTVKKKLLEEFAKSADSAAVHLKAASLPRQATRVLLPLNGMKPTEVHAPGFRDGEKVVLIRYPHAGTFEIPELTVNNRTREGKSLIGDARDAIGIHHSVAAHLSGADFDGDTVIVIPNNTSKVKHSTPLEQLKNFDPRSAYPPYHGMKTIDGGTWNEHTKSVDFPEKPKRSLKGQQMGDVSNLITDMTLRGAPHRDIALAVKHSMVVIDAEKHNLNWKQSAIDNEIPRLKKEYQGGARAGASTLISVKKRTERVPELKPRTMSKGGPIDRETGRRVFEETRRTTINKAGEKVLKKSEINLLDTTHDAHTLSSGTYVEKLYADHSNRLKALANQARLSSLKQPAIKRNPSAAKTYSREVDSITAKLTLAERNAPLERQAQVLAGAAIKARKQLNPNLERDDIQKLTYQEIEKARIRTGASRQAIQLTQEEWNAVQAGAISNNKLTKVLNKADMDNIRALATPRVETLMTANKTASAKALLANGYTRSEVAEHLGVSVSTLDKAIDA